MKAHSDWREEREESVLKPSKTRQVALSGLLFCPGYGAVVYGIGHRSAFGAYAGVKIGLANIVVMYALFFYGLSPGAEPGGAESPVRSAHPGAVAGLLSLCGGLLAAGDVAAV